MIYLDNAATTFPKPASVYREADRFVRTSCGNPGRGSHTLALAAAECVFGCRVALAELYGMGIDQIEYAAEISLEHHLGLTCDPVCGLVQIPCIERNAVAAMRAINAVTLSDFLSDTRRISFDKVVRAMMETGRDMSELYKETSEGGLAVLHGKD